MISRFGCSLEEIFTTIDPVDLKFMSGLDVILPAKTAANDSGCWIV
jgi:hypothetical protein